jgi:hypothetical protein
VSHLASTVVDQIFSLAADKKGMGRIQYDNSLSPLCATSHVSLARLGVTALSVEQLPLLERLATPIHPPNRTRKMIKLRMELHNPLLLLRLLAVAKVLAFTTIPPAGGVQEPTTKTVIWNGTLTNASPSLLPCPPITNKTSV